MCGLFPQAVGAPTVTPPPCALFESFFAYATPFQQSLSFNQFDRVRTALFDADARMASILLLAAPTACSFLLATLRMLFVVSMPLVGLCLLMSRYWHILRSLCVLFVSWSLSARFHVLGGVFPRSVGIAVVFDMGVVRVTWLCAPAGFSAGRSSLVQPACYGSLQESCSPGAGVASHTAYICHKRREFYLPHLPVYFSDVSKRSVLDSPAVSLIPCSAKRMLPVF